MDSVLALNLAEEASKQHEIVEDPALTAEVENLIAERKEAKGAKNFARADEIRQNLKERGILLEDSVAGTSWRRV